MKIFGPSRDQIWRQLSDQIGGDFVQGSFCKGSKIHVHLKQWTITPKFDDAFIIKGNDEDKLRKMFGNRKIRQLIEQQPKIYLTVRDGKGWFKGRFPEGVNQIYFRAPGVVKDVQRLNSLYELFAEILDHLCQIGSAYERDPRMAL